MSFVNVFFIELTLLSASFEIMSLLSNKRSSIEDELRSFLFRSSGLSPVLLPLEVQDT